MAYLSFLVKAVATGRHGNQAPNKVGQVVEVTWLGTISIVMVTSSQDPIELTTILVTPGAAEAALIKSLSENAGSIACYWLSEQLIRVVDVLITHYPTNFKSDFKHKIDSSSLKF